MCRSKDSRSDWKAGAPKLTNPGRSVKMRRVDLKKAEGATPVEIVLAIFKDMLSASKSEKAEMMLTFERALEGRESFLCTGGGARIEFGTVSTFVEALESGGYAIDELSIPGVLRSVCDWLEQRTEDRKNEAVPPVTQAAARSAMSNMASSTEPAVEYVPRWEH